ncbi:MAG: 1-deoxy-D-xylulose-5-phosphate synthase, partial [Clostridiales bacterium]|nr:1-deoxy-D-xylulose-5-phosphate synthase [Clostridiales bacterium]
YGPLDGHDINVLTDALTVAKKQNHAVLIHINTIKGKGYNPAEKNPTQFHGIGKFDIETGEPLSSSVTFSEAFGIAMSDFAGKDGRICAITAAMAEGTGLKSFAGAYPDKFFDVGIAEPLAVTFASGLARNGMLPVFAVYSTFFQRCYDQLVHDCAMQDLKVIFAVDRAGFVGEDGESHQGVFDVAFMNSIPNLSVYAPSNFEELRSAMYYSFYKEKYMTAIRYPRGPEAALPEDYEYNGEAFCVYGPEEAKCAIVTYGRLFANACRAKARLEETGLAVKIVKLNKIKPVAPDAVAAVRNCERVYFYEEALKSGGCGEKFAALLLESGFHGRYQHIAVQDEFIRQAPVSSQLAAYRLDADSMVEEVANDAENEA